MIKISIKKRSRVRRVELGREREGVGGVGERDG